MNLQNYAASVPRYAHTHIHTGAIVYGLVLASARMWARMHAYLLVLCATSWCAVGGWARVGGADVRCLLCGCCTVF